MKIQNINIFLIPLKFLLIYYVSKHAFQILTDEDKFYQKRGYNNACQKALNPLDKKICTFKKHSKFIFLYIDSLPFDLFTYKNNFLDQKSNFFKIKHFGISDSGPAFSGFVTGKIANKYEGRIEKIDNIFKQFFSAGFKINGFGYHYPIEEMIGDTFFESYRNIKEGLNEAFCEDFIRLHDVKIKEFKYIKESLIFDKKVFIEKFDAYYDSFTKQLQKKKKKIFNCLKKKITEQSLSYFIYNVYSDVIGHQYSRKSEIYIKKISALKSNLDLLIEYLQKYEKNTLLIVLSDHGIVSSVWESELTNHGSIKKNNESFLYIKSDKIQNNTNFNSYINSFDFACYISDYLKNVNYPMNSNGFSRFRDDKVFSKLVFYRSKENQLFEYFNSFEKNFLENLGLKFKNVLESSPFFVFLKKFEIFGELKTEESDAFFEELFGDLDLEKIFKDYEVYLEKLVKMQKVILDNKNDGKVFYNFCFGFIIFCFLIFKNLIEIFFSLKKTNRKIGVIILSIFTGLPIFFSIIQKIYPNYFFPYIILTSLLLIIYLHKDKKIENSIFLILRKKIILILILNFILIIYDVLVSFNNFYFFYYQNILIQSLLIFSHLFYTIHFLKKIKTRNQKYFSLNLKKLYIYFFVILDAIMILYEILLIFSFDYHQTLFMMYLSRIFYVLIIFNILLAFNFSDSYRLGIFFCVFKIIFWLGNNYIRIAFYFFIVPCLFIYSFLNEEFEKEKKLKKETKKIIQNKYQKVKTTEEKDKKITKKPKKLEKKGKNINKLFDFVFIIYQSINIFILLRGKLDTNISVRSGQKNWELTIEEFPSFTGAIFSINKFLPFIIIYFLLFLILKSKKKPQIKFPKKKFFFIKKFFFFFSKSFDSLLLKMTDIWFGFIMFIYLLNIDDAFNQRICFMFNTANIILVISSYIVTIAEFLIFYFEKEEGYRSVGQEQFEMME